MKETKQYFLGITYYLCGEYFQNKGKRLHRVVWEYNNGKIPKGYHIHHIDKDKHNNDIKNLEMLKSNIHLSNHNSTKEAKERSRKSIKIAQEFATEWHKSEEGLKWHSKQGKDNWDKRVTNKYICSYCGKEFETKYVYTEDSNRFCSNKCKATFRRKSGVDDIEIKCKMCGKIITVSKYSKHSGLCKECALENRWRK